MGDECCEFIVHFDNRHSEKYYIPPLQIGDPTADKIMQAGLKMDGLLEVC
jgi:hypothetical protein